MHVAEIDFPTFYQEALGEHCGAAEFVSRLRDLDANKYPAKIVMHQAARFVWLADRLEEFARGRDALQILFYVIAAETVAKVIRGHKAEGQSKPHVRLFFEEDCSDSARELLERAFAPSLIGPSLSLREAVDYLYRIRCDVAHKGRYFDYQLRHESGMPMLNPNRDGFLVAHIALKELRRIVLEGALLAAHRSLPENSACRGLLHA